MTTLLLRSLPLRLLLLAGVALGVGLLGWRVARAAIGDSVMTFVQRAAGLAPETQLAGADTAARFAPRDPLVRWQRGAVYLNSFNLDQTESHLVTAVEDLRQAAAASPEDYRVWITLGRALDANGATAEARGALERAAQLAPNHFDPRWALGNHLLRAGDRDASFAQMRLALSNRPSALPLVFDYAWNVYSGDAPAILTALNPPPETRTQMISLLLSRGKVDDALVYWRAAHAQAPFTPGELERIASALTTTGRYAAAEEVWRNTTNPADADRPAPDEGSLLANGGFERRLSLDATTPFLTWRLTPGGLMKISLDRKEPRAGAQALRVGFDLDGNIPFTVATQTVRVKPTTAYRLSFAARTEELQSLSMPLVEVFDAADPKRMRAAAPAIPTGTHDWKDYQVNFTTTAATEAVTVRVQRPPCGEPPCPLSGRLWLDAFMLQQTER